MWPGGTGVWSPTGAQPGDLAGTLDSKWTDAGEEDIEGRSEPATETSGKRLGPLGKRSGRERLRRVVRIKDFFSRKKKMKGGLRGSQVTEFDDDSYEEENEPAVEEEVFAGGYPRGSAHQGGLDRAQSEYPRRGVSKGLFHFRPQKTASRDRGSLPGDGHGSAGNAPDFFQQRPQPAAVPGYQPPPGLPDQVFGRDSVVPPEDRWHFVRRARASPPPLPRPAPGWSAESSLLHAPSILDASFMKVLSGVAAAASIAKQRSSVVKVSGPSHRRKDVLVDLDGVELWLVLPPYDTLVTRGGAAPGAGSGASGASGGTAGAAGSTTGTTINGGDDGRSSPLKPSNGGRTATPSTATPRGFAASDRAKGQSVQKHGGGPTVMRSPLGESSTLSGSSSSQSSGSPSLSRSSSGTYLNSDSSDDRSAGDSSVPTTSDCFISEALFAELSSSVYPAVSMLPRLQILSTAYKVPGFLLDEDQRKDSKSRQTVTVGALACCSLRLQQHFTEVGAAVDVHSLSVMIGTPTPCEAFVDFASPVLWRHVYPVASHGFPGDFPRNPWSSLVPTTPGAGPLRHEEALHASGQQYVRSQSDGRTNNWAAQNVFRSGPPPLAAGGAGADGVDLSGTWGSPGAVDRGVSVANPAAGGNMPLRTVADRRPYDVPLSVGQSAAAEEVAGFSRGAGRPIGAGRGIKDGRTGVEELPHQRGGGAKRMTVTGARGRVPERRQLLLRGLPMVLEGFSGAILLPNTQIRTDHLLSVSPSSLSFTGG